uniref:Prospero domain-containing protein n=1 Tax=Eptatretus burgeri TaxID=7764 RepID=A0A8C4X003_EPTBU
MHCHALSGSFIGAGQHTKRRRVDIGVKRSRLGITRTTDVRAARTTFGSRLRTTPECRPGCAVQLLEHDQVAMTPFGDMSVGVLRNLLNKGVGFEQDGFGQIMLQQHRLSEMPSTLSAPGVLRCGGESSDEDMYSDGSGVSRQERLSPQGSKCSTTGDGFNMQAKRARVENIIRSMNARTEEHGTTSPRENKRKQRLPQQQIESQLRELQELQHLKNDERRRLRKQIEEMQQQLVRLHRRFSCAYESEEEVSLKGFVDDIRVKKQSERKLDEEEDEDNGEECGDEHEHEDIAQPQEHDGDREASKERHVKQLEPDEEVQTPSRSELALALKHELARAVAHVVDVVNHHHPNKLFSAPPSQRLASNSHSSLGLEPLGPLRFASSSVRVESAAGRSLHSYGEQTSRSPQAHYGLVSPGLSTDQTEALPLVVRKGTPPGTERMTGGSPLPYCSQGLPISQTTTHGMGLGVPLGMSNHCAPLPQHHPLPIPQMAYLLHSSLAAAAAAAAGAVPGLASSGMGSSCRDHIPPPKRSTPDMLRGRTKLQPAHHLQHSSTIPTYSRRSCTPPLAHGSTDCLSLAMVKAEATGEMSETAELNVYSAGVISLARNTDGLTPTHLKKAKLIFFFTRYPSSTMLKVYFPDVKFNRCITSQLIKWFSNFREFFYIQMEKFARQALADGTVSADDVVVTRDSELFRVLNLHYNKSNDFQVPGRFLEVAEITLQEFFSAIQSGKDTDPSWKKSIYKVICKLDNDVPEVFRSPTCLQELLTD